jgi:Protein of unknown function (DUF3987)
MTDQIPQPKNLHGAKIPFVLSEAGRRHQAERERRWAEEKKRASDVLDEHESLKQQASFPVEALGKTLAEGARAVAKIIQCPVSMAAGVVLAHAAAAVQGIADVYTSKGKLLTSLAVLSIVESSEGKTGAEKIANKPFEDFEKELRKAHNEKMRTYIVAAAIWAAEREDLKKENDYQKLYEHERLKPTRPHKPRVLIGGGTVEGIIKALDDMPPSALQSLSEAAQFLRGAAFGEKNSASSGSMIIDLVDSGKARRNLMGNGRDVDGEVYLDDHRLSMNLMIQPEVVKPFLTNEELRHLALHARLLMIAPEPAAHTHHYNGDDDFTPEWSAIEAYSKMILALLVTAHFKRDSDGNLPHALCATGVDPRQLHLSRDAKAAVKRFHGIVTPLAAPGARYGGHMKEVALKTLERAQRIAGILTIVGNPNAAEISGNVMDRAISVAHWFLEEARRYYLLVSEAAESEHERQIIQWIRSAIEDPDAKWKPTPAQPDGWVITKDDMKRGPNALRKDKAAQIYTFTTMADAVPPRVYLVGGMDLRKHGTKVRIPRSTVYT